MKHRYLLPLGCLLAGSALAQMPATFAPVATYGTGLGSTPTDIVVADVNGDGRPDLLTANAGTNTAGVQLGTGTGTFGAMATYSTGAGSIPVAISVADVNGDGQPDLLTANASSNTAGVLLGTGTGTFTPVTTYSLGTGNPQGVAVADVNGDGRPDLLTANRASGTAGVLLGTGTGTFGPMASYSAGVGSTPIDLAVADINGDGRPDLLTANDFANTVSLLLGTSAGTFGAATTYSTGPNSDPVSLAVADVNGDGKLDVVTANYTAYTAGVLLGTGTGTFGAVTQFSTGAGKPYSIAVADVNADGQPDLLTANSANNAVALLLGTGTGTFGAATAYGTGAGSSPLGVAVADVNSDGRPDLLTANFNNTTGVLLNTTPTTNTATFGSPTSYSFAVNGLPAGVAVADVNGDGKLDVLTANNYTGTAGVLLGTGSGTFGAGATYPTGPGSRASNLAVTDVNGDGKPDLLTANLLGNTAAVLLGTGTGTFGAPTTYATGGGQPYSIAVADVNADGLPDLLTTNQLNSTVGVLLGTGAGLFGPATAYSTGLRNTPAGVAVADVNGDGQPDLLTANQVGNGVGVRLGTGAGIFGAVTTYSAGVDAAGVNSDPNGLVVADMNGDGKRDIVTANYTNGTVGVLLGTGTGSFGAPTLYSTGPGSQPSSVAVADVNGDGKPDVVTANAGNNKVGVLLGNGTGSFGPITAYGTGSPTGSAFGIAVADVNADGRPDLVVTTFNGGTVAVLLNTSTVLATAVPAAAPTLTLYPNPARSSATLSATGLPAAARTVEASLLSPVGQVVRRLTLPATRGAATGSVPTTGLAAGLYLLQLSARDAQGGALEALPTQRLSVE